MPREMVWGGLPDEVGADEQSAHGRRGSEHLWIGARVARVDVRVLCTAVDPNAARAETAGETLVGGVAERDVADAPVRPVGVEQRVLVLPRVAGVRHLRRG